MQTNKNKNLLLENNKKLNIILFACVKQKMLMGLSSIAQNLSLNYLSLIQTLNILLFILLLTQSYGSVTYQIKAFIPLLTLHYQQ